MRLTAYDAFEIMTWVLDPNEPWTIIDAGAHEGVVADHMLAAFPRATVYAFEPIPETFETLARRAQSSPRLRPVHAALGDANGHAEMHVNRHSMTTSMLPASERGVAYYGEWLDCVRKERVDVVRLDDWARRNGVDAVHAMKIDVQGFEAQMLRGAERLLRESVVAVYSEAQLIPEYEGASTYSDIDSILRDYGFGLHQIVDIHFKGTLHETACCDALWIKQPVLDELRLRPHPNARLRPGARILGIFEDLAASGTHRVGIYGAGLHTRTRMAEPMAESPAPIVCVIDDDASRQGSRLWGLPIVSREQAIGLGVDAVVLSSDSHEDALWANAKVFRDAGIPVVRLYDLQRGAVPESSTVTTAR